MKKEKREKEQFTVVLEDIRSKFDLFAEGMSRIHQKLESHDKNFTSIDTKIENISDDVFIIKETIKLIRGDLNQKVGYEEFESLEKRVSFLEDKARK